MFGGALEEGLGFMKMNNLIAQVALVRILGLAELLLIIKLHDVPQSLLVPAETSCTKCGLINDIGFGLLVWR